MVVYGMLSGSVAPSVGALKDGSTLGHTATQHRVVVVLPQCLVWGRAAGDCCAVTPAYEISAWHPCIVPLIRSWGVSPRTFECHQLCGQIGCTAQHAKCWKVYCRHGYS